MAVQHYPTRPSRRRKVNQPFLVTCVKCGTRMTLAGTESKNTYGHGFERKAFQCDKCGHVQTYTMGATLHGTPERARRSSRGALAQD